MRKIFAIIGLIILTAIAWRGIWAFQKMKDTAWQERQLSTSDIATSTALDVSLEIPLKVAILGSVEKEIIDKIKKTVVGESSVVSIRKEIPVGSTHLRFSFNFPKHYPGTQLSLFINETKVYSIKGDAYKEGTWNNSEFIDIANFVGKEVILSFLLSSPSAAKQEILLDDLLIVEITEATEENMANKASVPFKVSTPLPGQYVASPLFVVGEADAYWFPEGWFEIVLYDANNNAISLANANATIIPLMPSKDGRIPFASRELKFSKPTTNTGYLVLKKHESAKSDAGDYKIPVRFR